MLYANGGIPYSVVSVVLGSGTDENGYYEFRGTPAFAARWAAAKAYALRTFGRTIYIRTGWNVYRPYNIQVIARNNACASGNCDGAAVAGSSSHGGNWAGRDCLAVDVDPNGLSWDQVDEAMGFVGFSARLITEAMSGIPGGERWHYIDFNAFGPVPAELSSTDFTNQSEEDDDMKAIIQAGQPDSGIIIQAGVPPYALGGQVFDALRGAYGLTVHELADWQYATVVREQWTAAKAAAALTPNTPLPADAIATIVSGINAGIDDAVSSEFGVDKILERLSTLPSEVVDAVKARL